MRQFQLQLLPAMTARAMLVCEGPHDVAALRAVAERLESIKDTPPLHAHRIELIDGGGKDHMWKVAALARQLGFHTVSLLDWDRDDDEAESALVKVEEDSDFVIRLPLHCAMERALLSRISDDALESALETVIAGFQVKAPPPKGLDRPELEDVALKHVLKKGGGGLHAAFVEALPPGVVPKLVAEVLTVATDSVLTGRSGKCQLA